MKLDDEKLNVESDMNRPIECDACEFGKSHRAPFNGERDPADKAKEIMDCWHLDVSGPIEVKAIGIDRRDDGGRYMSLIVDEASHWIFVDVQKAKDDTEDNAIKNIKYAETATGLKLKRFHSDGGGEYRSDKLRKLLADRGTRKTDTTAHTPQHNPIAERENRTVWELARTLMQGAGKYGVPKEFWGFAVKSAAYILNRTTSRGSIDPTKTAYELWTGHKPSVSHMRDWGCDAYVHVPEEDRKKLDAKARLGIFVGYDESKRAYFVYVNGTVVSSRDVTFYENRYTAAEELHHERVREEMTVEERREEELKRKQRMQVELPPSSLSGRRAARIAKDRLSEPWNDDEEERLVRAVQIASAEDEADRLALAEGNKVLDTPNEEERKEVDANESESGEIVDEEVAPVEEMKNSKKKRPKKTVAFKLAAVPPTPSVSTRRSDRSRPPVNYSALAGNDSPIIEPTTVKDVMNSPQREEWIKAMKAELKSLQSKHVWDVVSNREAIRSGHRPIGCKWVFKAKLNSDGSIARYKARLVAKGFTQREGIDFNETFAPVMKYKSLRILLNLAALMDWEIKQMDVETAFLNGELKETVYMKMPPGLELLGDVGMKSLSEAACIERGGDELGLGGVNQVCLLKKAIYGTKQASNVWHESIHSTLLGIGFQSCISDPCVYIKFSLTGNPILLGLFVDDLIPIYATEDADEWNALKKKLCQRYEMKDLGDAEFVLGMKITRDRASRSLMLTQEVYAEKVVHQFGMSDCKPLDTPEEVGLNLSSVDCAASEEEMKQMEGVPYMEVVGSLLYATISVRPDLSHVVGVLSRYMSRPGINHWKAAKRVLRYLKGTTKLGIRYGLKQNAWNDRKVMSFNEDASYNTPSIRAHPTMFKSALTVYCDADWAGDMDDRRSTSGCVIMLFGAPIVWVSKKQATVALSTAEAEYMAMSMTLQELKWVKQFLTEIQFAPILPIPIKSDNQAAISIANNAALPHSRTKHIDIRHHYVREQVVEGEVKVEWVASKDQLADVFTKGLNRNTYKELTQQIMTQEEEKQEEVSPSYLTAASSLASLPLPLKRRFSWSSDFFRSGNEERESEAGIKNFRGAGGGKEIQKVWNEEDKGKEFESVAA